MPGDDQTAPDSPVEAGKERETGLALKGSLTLASGYGRPFPDSRSLSTPSPPLHCGGDLGNIPHLDLRHRTLQFTRHFHGCDHAQGEKTSQVIYGCMTHHPPQ